MPVRRTNFIASAKSAGSVLRLYPIVTDNRITRYRPRFVTRHEFDEVISYHVDQGQPAQNLESVAQTGEDWYGQYMALSLAP